MADKRVVGSSPVTRGQGYNEQLSNAVPAAIMAGYLRFACPEAPSKRGVVDEASGDTNTIQEQALMKPTHIMYPAGVTDDA